MTNNGITLQDYAAETRFERHKIDIPFLEEEGIIPIGIDIGYSSTKVYSIFGSYMFLSLPIRVADSFCPPLDETDIMYKDMEGNKWIVGRLASKNLDRERIQAQPEIIYGRYRIDSSEYLVLLRVGLFLGLIENELKDEYKIATNSRLAIQTGLPCLHLIEDRFKLEKQFVGKHCYQVKIGNKKWQTISIDIKNKDVFVESQPFGTLWALGADRYGEITNIALLKKGFLIFDVGHRMANTYYNKHGHRGTPETSWDDLSMLEVIRQVKMEVNNATYGQGDFLDYFFDRILTLETPESRFGKIPYGDEQIYDITDDVFEITEKVAQNAVQQLDILYYNLNYVDILFLTGGMAKAYYPYFKKYYDDPPVPVMLAEKKDSKDPIDNFDTVMANAVGYFNYLVYQLKRNMKDKNGNR